MLNNGSAPFPNCYDGLDVLAPCYAGSCVNGTCVCDPGWSGMTDYTPMDLSPWGGPVLSCGVYVVLVKVLWGFAAVPGFFHMFAWIPAMREQYRVFRKKRARSKWYYHLPLLGTSLAVFVEFTTLFALVAVKLAMDGGNLIGVHPIPTIMFAIGSLNMNFWVMVNDLILLRSALRSPLARGSQTPSQIENRVRQLSTQRILSAIPIFFLDVPTLISTAIVPVVSADDPILLLKRQLYVIRILHLILGVSIQYWNAWRTWRLMSLMFTQILDMPMDDGPRKQVVDLRDRVKASVQAQKKAATSVVVVQTLMIVPVWFTLAITYYQPIGRTVLSFAMYKVLRAWTKVGAGKALVQSAGTIKRGAGSILNTMTRRGSKRGSASISTTPGERQKSAWGSSQGDSSNKYSVTGSGDQANTDALRRALGSSQ